MANSITSQLYDGARNVNLKRTCFGDGTTVETGVVILDVTTLNPNPGLHLKLRRLRYAITGGWVVRLQWDATTPVDIAVLGAGQDILDFTNEYAGGFPNNGGAGATGNILITTVGPSAGPPADGYTLNLELIKGV